MSAGAITLSNPPINILLLKYTSLVLIRVMMVCNMTTIVCNMFFEA